MNQRQKRIELKICPATNSRRRRAWRATEHGNVYFCGDEPLLLKSRRIVRERLNLYSEMLQELSRIHQSIEERAGAHVKRLVHNLISQNAHNIQEVYNIASQEVLSLSMSQQIENVTEQIEDNPTMAAKALLRINKNNLAMKCEFAAFRFLHETTKASLNKRPHNIRKVVMNALHPFFQDFKEKRVYVEADDYDASVKIDYETTQVALYHIIDNAAKYTLPETRLRVSYPVIESRQIVRFDMVSLHITESDMERIFDEGYSGEIPRKLGLAGSGLGLALARQLLDLNDVNLFVRRNVDTSKRQSTLLAVYENNQFDIILGKPF